MYMSVFPIFTYLYFLEFCRQSFYLKIGVLLFLLLIHVSFILFSCLLHWLELPALFSQSAENGYFCLVSNIKGKALSFSL